MFSLLKFVICNLDYPEKNAKISVDYYALEIYEVCVHIIAVGADHNTASIALREQLACTTRQVPQILNAARLVVQECVLVSTCNRIEFYAVCQDIQEGLAHLYQILSETRQVDIHELHAHCYEFIDEQAVTHLFGVACGLYSLVPGEPQIQGQIADAIEIAQGGGYAGPITSALFRSAIVAGKRARSETGISRRAVSVSHVAVQLAKQLFPKLNTASILLVGSGQMSELAARNLCDNGAERLVIINRTHSNAIEMAERMGATHRTFHELSQALVEADVVISSTTAPRALITRSSMEQVMEERQGRSLLLIDIALPRDVEPEVSELNGVHLYNIDDLQAEVSEGIRLRLQEVEHVQAIIAKEAQNFGDWLRSLSVVDTIRDLRRYANSLREKEVGRTMRHLSPTLSEREEDAVHELTNRLMNKLLHKPMSRLKEAAASGQGHIYAEALRYLFDLEENSDETYNDRNESQQARDDANNGYSRKVAPATARPGDQRRADSH